MDGSYLYARDDEASTSSHGFWLPIPSGQPHPPMASTATDLSTAENDKPSSTKASVPTSTGITEATTTDTSSSATAGSSFATSLATQTSTALPVATETTSATPNISTGAIIGASLGSAAAAAVIVLLAVVMLTTLRRRGGSHQDTERDESEGSVEFVDTSEKHPQQESPGGDPFEPFGGRADGHAASCTFELDSTAIGPSQMTAPPSETHGGTAVTMPQQPPETRLPGQGHVDPRANLNSLGYNDGQPRYVNHWNQYREMGSSS